MEDSAPMFTLSNLVLLILHLKLAYCSVSLQVWYVENFSIDGYFSPKIVY